MQTLPSLQVALISVCTHPVAGSQLSAVHALWSLQSVAAPGRQAPPPQTSPAVHALPSLHALDVFVWKQPEAGLHPSLVQTLPSLHVTDDVSVNTQPVAGAHESTVHALLSLQTRVPVGWQLEERHRSPVVHALPSLQDSVLFACVQPVEVECDRFSAVPRAPAARDPQSPGAACDSASPEWRSGRNRPSRRYARLQRRA